VTGHHWSDLGTGFVLGVLATVGVAGIALGLAVRWARRAARTWLKGLQ